MQSVLFWMCFLISISANFGFFRWGPLQLLRIFLVLEWWILRSSFVSGRATSFLGPKLVLTRRLCGNNFRKSWILVFFCWADSDFGKISSSLDALILTCSGLVRDEHELFNENSSWSKSQTSWVLFKLVSSWDLKTQNDSFLDCLKTPIGSHRSWVPKTAFLPWFWLSLSDSLIFSWAEQSDSNQSFDWKSNSLFVT